MLKKLMNMKKKKGFTLIELIVVLVIMAILAAAAIPTMMGYVDEAKANQHLAEGRSVYVSAQAGATEAYGKITDYVGDAGFTGSTATPKTQTISVKMGDPEPTGKTVADYIKKAILDVSKIGLPTNAEADVIVDTNGTITKVEYYTAGKAADGYKVTITIDMNGESSAEAAKYKKP